MVRDDRHTGGILALFAHPDDEEFGTAGALHRCARRGIPVRVLSATSGGAGEISDPSLATRESLAAVREKELRAACALLGFAEPLFLRHGDGELAEIDPARLRDDLVAAIRRERPRLVLTFDADGGYGHPDHIAIHRATLAAVERAAEADHQPGLGPSHAVDKVYVTAYPRSVLTPMNDDLERHGFPRLDFGPVQTLAAEELGTADARITTAVAVDADDVWRTRTAAMRAHRTQYGPGNPFVALPDAVLRRWMAVDSFVRLKPAPAPGTVLPDEDDLWAGLPG